MSNDLPDRMTIVLNIYHQHPGEDANHVSNVESRLLNNACEIYSRRIEVMPEWKTIDLGWVGNMAGMIVIQNIEDKDLTKLPSPEEKELIQSKTILLSYDRVKSFEIKVGSCHYCTPTHLEDLFISCPTGKALARITVIPS